MYGCDVNVFDVCGWILIYDVICYDRIEIVFKLFENGVDLGKSFFVVFLNLKNFDFIGRGFFMFFIKFYIMELLMFVFFEWSCLLFVVNCYQFWVVVKLIYEYLYDVVKYYSLFGRIVFYEVVNLLEGLNFDKEVVV